MAFMGQNFVKIFYSLILVVLILFPLGELLRFNVGNDVVIKPIDILILTTSLGYFIYNRKSLRKASLFTSLLIFFIIAGLSLFLNLGRLTNWQIITSATYLVRWIGYAGLYFIVRNLNKESVVKLKTYLIIDGFVILMLGLVQYLWYPNLRNLYYLGWDEHNFRLFSTFLDPNFTGGFLVLYFVFILDYVFKNKKNIFWILLVGATTAGIFLTFSRSALIMFAVTTATYLYLKSYKKLIFYLLGLIILFVLLTIISSTTENTNLFRSASSFSRVDSATQAIAVIKSSPLYGVGFNAYRYALRNLNIEKNPTQFENHANAGTDMSILFVLATTGILGCMAYIYLLIRIIKLTTKSALVRASVVGIMVQSLFVNSLFYAPFMLWMWILLGTIDRD